MAITCGKCASATHRPSTTLSREDIAIVRYCNARDAHTAGAGPSHDGATAELCDVLCPRRTALIRCDGASYSHRVCDRRREGWRVLRNSNDERWLRRVRRGTRTRKG